MSEEKKNAQPKYKDTVFRAYFGHNTSFLLELYEAIEGVSLAPDTEVEINTIEDALYRDRLNDISFLLGGKLVVLIEQQSTINNNMPIRLLKYIAELYDGMLTDEQRYRKAMVALPWPEFVIFYGGEEPWGKDSETISLSDAFRKNGDKLKTLGIDINSTPPLELTAKIININEGHSPQVLKASHALHEYSAFIAKVREEEKIIANGRRIYDLNKNERKEAIRKAVDWCIANNIMKDFLTKHRKEVVDMLHWEWDFDMELKVTKQEGREEGREEKSKEDAEEVLRLIRSGYSLEELEKTYENRLSA
jgi:hypothetical protein